MKKNYLHWKKEEREQLEILLKTDMSKQDIADLIGKDRSTIYREIARNDADQNYSAKEAHNRYLSNRSKPIKIEQDKKLKKEIISLLKKKYSPGQIVWFLKRKYGQSPVSAETIYQYIYSQSGQKEGLSQLLRRKQKVRKSRVKRNKKAPTIPNRTSISARSQAINDRNEFGHWEGDLMLFSKQSSTLITLRERKSRVMLAVKNTGKEAVETAKRIIKTFLGKNKEYILSCTVDNGGEFTQHEMIAQSLNAEIYFCDPYASYQKGSVEQGNGTIRAELPRKCDFESMTQNEINKLMRGINRRPMALHNGASPSEIFQNICGGNLSGVVALQT